MTPVMPDLDTLAAENQLLRSKLIALTDEARHNEDKMQRYRAHELRLLAANSFAELVRMLLDDTRSVMGLATVTLTLVDPDHELRRLLEEQGLSDACRARLSLVEGRHELDRLFRFGRRPRLGRFDSDHHESLFDLGQSPASVALLPLVRGGELIGSLNFGSDDPGRFVPELGTVFLEHLAAIVASVLKSAVNQERLKQTGLVDALTGVNNRRYFDQRLVEEVTRGRRRGEPLTCLFLDIDHFKRINDNFDHPTGDRVLCAVASAIKAQLRASDVLARYGGEEFVCLLASTRSDEAAAIAERIREQVAGLLLLADDGTPIRVTISIGMDTLAGQVATGNAQMQADALVARADRALLYAKEHGRNRIVDADRVNLGATGT